MSSAEQPDALRELSRDLLKRLKLQRDELEALSGGSQSRKREREDGAEGGRDTAETRTLTRGDPGPARAARHKRTVRFADTCERQINTQSSVSTSSLTSKHSGAAAEHTQSSGLFKEGSRRPLNHSTRPTSTKSCLVDQSHKQRDVLSQATSLYDECKDASKRHHLQPLLGYDLIAGVLDAEDNLIERSDEFFNDLSTFRSLNRDECVHSPHAEFLEENPSVLPLLTDSDLPDTNLDTHQCTFSYRINSRLFPVPLHSEESCPVCKQHKSSHPHTAAEPALIRVSIPRSSLLPPYKYKAHRRSSFDPSDSLGLPSHCLSGWSNTGQISLSPPSNLDLKSSVNMKSSGEAQNKELEDLSPSKVSRDQISDQISVSRLARHNFQHFSSKRKLGNTFYPLL